MFNPNSMFDSYITSKKYSIEALSAMNEISLWPESLKIKFNMIIEINQRGTYALANQDLNLALTYFVDCLEKVRQQPEFFKTIPSIYCQIGGCYNELPNSEISEDYFKLALQADNEYGPAYWMLGLKNSSNKKYEKAIFNFEKAIENNFYNALLYYLLANAYCENARNLVITWQKCC